VVRKEDSGTTAIVKKYLDIVKFPPTTTEKVWNEVTTALSEPNYSPRSTALG
jgi:hypothetical protein